MAPMIIPVGVVSLLFDVACEEEDAEAAIGLNEVLLLRGPLAARLGSIVDEERLSSILRS